MAEDDDSDKQYEASQRKLDRARDQGDIAHSPDFVSALVLSAIAMALWIAAEPLAQTLGKVMVTALESGASTTAPPNAAFRDMFETIFPLLTLLIGAGAATALLASGITQGIRLAPAKLAPKFSRISPWSGLKGKFGKEALTGFLIGQLKLWTLVVVAAVLYGRWMVNEQARLINLEPGQTGLFGGEVVLKAVLIFAGITATFGAVDYFMKLVHFRTRMMMSRKELMDEHKESDGDPHMKSQRRQRGQEIALNKMMGEVPKADVVIVNPTHYAVALKWSRKKGSVPVVVAKGTDEVAARIRHAAQVAGVPIHRDPPTARAIHATVALGREIQPDHYKAVAIAIRFAEQIRQKAKRRII